MESDGKKLTYGDLVCNATYIYLLDGINHDFISIQIKIVTVSMNTVDIPSIDVKVWTRKSELRQGNFLRSLTSPKITRQRTFEVIDI